MSQAAGTFTWPGGELRDGDRRTGSFVHHPAERGELGGVQDGVGEEGSRAPAVRVSGIEDHAFAAAEPEHGRAHVAQRGPRALVLAAVVRAGRTAGRW